MKIPRVTMIIVAPGMTMVGLTMIVVASGIAIVALGIAIVGPTMIIVAPGIAIVEAHIYITASFTNIANTPAQLQRAVSTCTSENKFTIKIENLSTSIIPDSSGMMDAIFPRQEY